VAENFEISADEIIRKFSQAEFPVSRMNILEGINHSTIIDDTYNSSPVALEQALLTLQDIKAKGRKIVALGDMLELGDHSVQAHKQSGKLATDSANYIFTAGVRAKTIAESAIENGFPESRTMSFRDSSKLAEYLQTFVDIGDVVLIKGSQGIRMEKVSFALLKHKSNAHNLIARHDKTWLKK
jgi:UDP-N-acetylmuramoyl-tripeptide--D-alanyl-D-alanine ligase